MTIKVYDPAIQVTLFKLVGKFGTAFTGGAKQIDLTPYLGDAGSVRTTKTIMSPAGGFSITFADKFDPQTDDSVYAFVEPMDAIEIRMARSPSQYAGTKLPLVMRGFVSSVRRVETIGADGTPQRVVVILGQDAGKLWLINQILFDVAIISESNYLSAFHLQAVTGIDPVLLPCSDFMTQLCTRVLNPKIAMLNAINNGQIKPFIVDASVPFGALMPQQAANFDTQPVWGLVEMFADRPWNEAFIQDQEDGPHFIFRPAPYYDINGNLIVGGAVDPGTVDVDISAVVSLDLMRSDARVANYFWVPPGPASTLSAWSVNAANLVSGAPLDDKNAANNPALYGLRKMTAATNYLYESASTIPLMLPPAERTLAIQNMVDWSIARMALLKLMNRDNSLFEEGAAVLQGDENLQAGTYLNLTRGDLTSKSYIVAVAHTFSPLLTWTTEVALERGTGFINRSKSGGQPYFSEGRAGPYS